MAIKALSSWLRGRRPQAGGHAAASARDTQTVPTPLGFADLFPQADPPPPDTESEPLRQAPPPTLHRPSLQEDRPRPAATPAPALAPASALAPAPALTPAPAPAAPPRPATMQASPLPDEVLTAWAMEELAYWRLHKVDTEAASSLASDIAARSRDIRLYRFGGGTAELVAHPAGLDEEAGTKGIRPLAYLAFFQDVARMLPPGYEATIAVGLGDRLAPRAYDMPVFCFQKRQGERSVLLPDIDFLLYKFYADPRYRDTLAYTEKMQRAIFVGSTTGGNITTAVARNLGFPRLRAGRFFQDSDRVDFHLPNIVQCDTEEASDILRQMPFCSPVSMGWAEQLSRRLLLSMDGNGATCSRVAVALASNSVLVKYESDHVLFYFRGLQPWLHFIPVAEDADVERLLDMEEATPELFAFVARNGSRFASAFLTREALLAYTAKLLVLYPDCFAASPARYAAAIQAQPAAADAPQAVRRPRRIFLVAHIQDRGDVAADAQGWAGGAGDTRKIEGFSLSLAAPRLTRAIACRTIAADGTQSPPVPGGLYCGTKDRNQAICGFSIEVEAGIAGMPALVYEGVFADGTTSGPIKPATPCRSPSGAALVGMRIGQA